MKQVVFSCLVDGKKVTGSYLCENRPSRPIDVVDNLVKGRITNFRSFIKDIKTKFVKLDNVEE